MGQVVPPLYGQTPSFRLPGTVACPRLGGWGDQSDQDPGSHAASGRARDHRCPTAPAREVSRPPPGFG